MQYIHSYVVPMLQEPGIEGAVKQIELAGRVSYKSEDRIDEASAKKFFGMLVQRGHLSPLEHGTVYMKVPNDVEGVIDMSILLDNPYTIAKWDKDQSLWYVTTNYRVIMEAKLEPLMKYVCEPEDQHIRRYTFRIVCSRGVSHELVRHEMLCAA